MTKRFKTECHRERSVAIALPSNFANFAIATATPRNDRRVAFTLAEVLITLAIIGVVATMTIPTLVADYQKKVVVTRMQKFYTTFNQAIKLSSIDNGHPSTWTFPTMYNYDENLEFVKKYITPYIKIQKFEWEYYEKLPILGVKLYLLDGSAVTWDNNYLVFYPVANKNEIEGKDTFIFTFFARDRYEIQPFRGYMQTEVVTDRNTLINDSTYGCGRSENANRRYCAALIVKDGWKIADDYPIKF